MAMFWIWLEAELPGFGDGVRVGWTERKDYGMQMPFIETEDTEKEGVKVQIKSLIEIC